MLTWILPSVHNRCRTEFFWSLAQLRLTHNNLGDFTSWGVRCSVFFCFLFFWCGVIADIFSQHSSACVTRHRFLLLITGSPTLFIQSCTASKHLMYASELSQRSCGKMKGGLTSLSLVTTPKVFGLHQYEYESVLKLAPKHYEIFVFIFTQHLRSDRIWHKVNC